MKVLQMLLKNIRCFTDTGRIRFSKKINVFTGLNNSGKSTILKSIYIIQGHSFAVSDIKIRNNTGKILLEVGDINNAFEASRGNVNPRNPEDENGFNFALDLPENRIRLREHGTWRLTDPVKGIEPNNAIYPYLSKRKVGHFNEQVSEELVNQVPDNLTLLVSKIDRIYNPQHECFEEFRSACRDIIGTEISAFASHSGKRAGIFIGNHEKIPLESMGEGVAHVLGLLSQIFFSTEKIFLIEELENDLHPKALKRLLDLIVDKSNKNQFFISTHSNIVLKHLGSIRESKIFNVSIDWVGKIPRSSIEEIGNNQQRRKEILEDMGYEFHDFGLWSAWLVLEESTAEAIINEILIPSFTKNLSGQIRTISTNGNSSVIPKFDDFNRLFLYTHLEPMYKNRTWVCIDGDDKGVSIVDTLKSKYCQSGWKESQFRTLKNTYFESYYPEPYKKRFDTEARGKSKNEIRELKRILCEDIKKWYRTNPDECREQFSESALEVINTLKEIEGELLHRSNG